MERDSRAQRTQSLLIGAASASAAAITAGVTAAGAHAISGVSGGAVAADALVRGLIVALPVAVALYARQRPAHARFGNLLLVVSGLWFIASFANSSTSFLYSIGFVSGWLAQAGLACAVLAFPDGRLHARVDRALVAILAAALTVLYLPTALLVERYPSPSPWSNCDLRCPPNAFRVSGAEPAVINGFVRPLREVLVALVFVAVAARLAQRIRAANHRTRRTLKPVLFATIIQLAMLAVLIFARRAAPHSGATRIGAWLVALAIPAIALAFLVGLARWELFVSAAIRHVNARLREMPGPEQVQSILADEFEDPTLRIGSWSRGRRRWIAAGGDELDPPVAGSGSCLSVFRDGSGLPAAIVHDELLRGDPAFLGAAASAATVAFETDRRAGRSDGLIRELTFSRARIMAAADGERRRIERDLHDGAQQRLVALRVQLELAAEKAKHDPTEAAALRELGSEVELALEEMRSLTHGIYPAVLADNGLAEAVLSLARRSPVPASVKAEGLGDYPQEILTAVYFSCAEALQNVAKHAPSATAVRITLRESKGVLRFSLSDDGPGLDEHEARVGAGLVNMRDRVATVGGELTVRSAPGRGTVVSARIPISAASSAAGASDQHRSHLSRGAAHRSHT